MRCALGLSVHTGWAACVIVAGSPRAPRVLQRARIELLGDADRFVYHRAAEMGPALAEPFLEQAKTAAHERAIVELRRSLGSLEPTCCAIVARPAPLAWSLADIVAAHPRIHTAEGCFYRDALASAARQLDIDVLVIAPKELDPARVGDLVTKVGRPWGKDQKLAALAAWTALGQA